MSGSFVLASRGRFRSVPAVRRDAPRRRVRHPDGGRLPSRRWRGAARRTVVCGVSCSPASRSTGDFTVVVYCSADKAFAELVFQASEAKTSVKILPFAFTPSVADVSLHRGPTRSRN
jgi:hypothetical protein